MSGKRFVETPEAAKFIDRASLTNWHEVWFGNPKKMPKEVHPFMQASSRALLAGLGKIAGLVDDPTKTLVVKHETGKKIAENTIAALLDNKNKQIAFGQRMMAEANEAINAAFSLDAINDRVVDRIIDFINANTKSQGKIREAMEQDPKIVAVLSNIPAYTFDLADEVVKSIVFSGYKQHTPEARDKLLQGEAVIKAAAGYDRAIKGVHASFYNETLASQAAKRVEA